MATYTFILNERFSGAKKLLESLKSLNFVEIQPNNTKEISPYDQEFVKKIERSRSSKGKKIKIDESLEDIKVGRVTTYKSSNDLFKKLGI